MRTPNLTVVVTSYNYSKYISRCIESILEQDYSDFELIILDNGSEDGTINVVSKYLSDDRVSFVCHEYNVGLYTNFNLALRAGVGRYLAVVSADDYLLPGHFSKLIAVLQKSEAVIAYTPIVLVDKDDKHHGMQKHPGYASASYEGGRDDFTGLLAYDCYVTLCAVVFDRNRVKEDLYFDIGAGPGLDWEFFVRLALKYRDFAFDCVPTACSRVHDEQYSATNFYSSLEPLFTHLLILERYIDYLLLRGNPRYNKSVADYLKRRMGQYESSRYLSIDSRLKNLLGKLDGSECLFASGSVLVVINFVSDLDISRKIETLYLVDYRGCDFFLVGPVSVLSTETLLRIKDLLGGKISFLAANTPSSVMQINEQIRFSSVEFVLVIDTACNVERDSISAALKLIHSQSAEMVCFRGGDKASAFSPIGFTEFAEVHAVIFRKSKFCSVGGFLPIMCFGGLICEFVNRMLRLGDLTKSFAASFVGFHGTINGSLDIQYDLARALLIFANTIFFGCDEIVRAVKVISERSDCYLPSVDSVLESQPACSPAHFIRALARSGRKEKGSYKFSVIVITFNRPKFLEGALASLNCQTLRDFEVILVNDNGEHVERLLADLNFPITYLRLGKNGGPAAARNAALKLARGRYVTYLDDDDLYLQDHLQCLAQAAEENPGKVVYADAVFILENIRGEERIELNRELRYQHSAYSKERLFVDNYIPINTFACPRSVAVSVGGFDESLNGLEDWDFLLRLAAHTPFHHVQRETVQVRMRQPEAGTERRSEQALKDYPALYQTLYSRHSDFNSLVVREGRRAMLKRFGVLEHSKTTKAFSVEDWLKARSFTPAQKEQVAELLQRHSDGPSFSVVLLDLQGEPDKLKASLASLSQLHQTYTNIQPIVLTVNEAVDGAAHVVQVTQDNWLVQLNELLSQAAFDWFSVAAAGDEFTENGLLVACLELVISPEYRAVFCDEIYRQVDEDLGLVLRPSFNLDYVLSFPAGMARHWLFRRDVFLEAGCFNTQFPNAFEFEFILRLVNQGGLAGLGHISEPLLITEMPALANVEDERLAIIRHLQARGYPEAQVTAAKPGRYHLEYKHAGNPVVSILITAGEHLSKLQRCIEGLLESTAYQTFEILLVESHPLDQAVHEWLLALAELQEAKLRVVQSASQNMSAMFNEAANQASGDYLLFLASDTATLEEGWLDNLLNHAQRAEVGGVGGRLLTPDGKIAQAIQILGLQGPVGNPYVGEKLDEPGYMQRLQVDQNVSALSQDCLMLPRDLYLQLGGLDEEEIPAPYAMTDLCLRIREAGYLLVWSPSVQLMLDRQGPTLVSAQQQDAMYAKWLSQLARDPAYNANFSLAQPGGFKLADTQISWRPLDVWRPLPVVLAHPADTMGCGHYRIMQPFNALCEAGMVDGGVSEGLMHVVDLERYNPDAVILQRQIGEVRLEAMRQMKAFSRAFKVYELDDYLPNLPMKSVHRQHMPRDIVKSLRKGLSYVDRFVVSTDVMAEAFSDFHPDIRVVKNRLDPRWWGGLPVSARRISKKPRVGWAGGSSHTGDLEMVADVVKELAGEVEWVFFGMCPEKLKPYVHEFHEGVAIEGYAKKLASLNLDLALAPVEQNLFNECKSNLRLLEYGACGFPVICSDVRCYQGDGLPVTRVKNRFRDWVDAIRAHINDLDSAARAGDELRAAVLNGWMLEGENLEAWRKAWLPD
ncbi:glycosyltransferase [Stutzerimonas zhaodongensis]|uniref:glycosyltransferase n=1 Tax=Stutzerimonas zhaodongensis TaxID=1176257 RepID=UPI001F4DD114|nr:glycosyltransferase [Stutzerimonas zhaodongensis]UNG20561.1 glycosyltransferase [Stutzerimonas zhaodongensis]